MRASVRSAMRLAYTSRDPKRARRLLENLAHKLESPHPSAAVSLREGLDRKVGGYRARPGWLRCFMRVTLQSIARSELIIEGKRSK